MTAPGSGMDYQGRSVERSAVDPPQVSPHHPTPNPEIDTLLAENSHLRKRIAELETLINAHSSVVVTDRDGVITSVNRNFLLTLKYSREEVIGQTHRLVNSGRHPREFFTDLWRTISRGDIWQGDICDRAKDGREYWGTTTIVPLLDERGVPEHFVAIRNDITRLHEMERELWQLAYFDARTGLPSRTSVVSAYEETLQRDGDAWSAFLSISLDDLDPVNDALGYARGDALLRYAARRLRELREPVQTVGYIDTGIFGLILGGLSSVREEAEAEVIAVAERAPETVGGRVRLGAGVELENTATAGFRLYRPGEDDLASDDVIATTEIARKRARTLHARVSGFDPVMLEEMKSQVDLVHDLRRGIANGALCLFLQPIVDADRRIICYEGLVRWRDEKRGLVSPSEFIPIAERTGLINDIGTWVLEEACRLLADWKTNEATRDLRLSINVSEQQLSRSDFSDAVCDALNRHGAPPERLRVEVTEGTLQSNIEQAISTLRSLHRNGVLVALDDFGTGYSSLGCLRELPVQQLKIDRTFVQDITHDPVDAELVRSIVHLAHYMGLMVVAEGVEREEQFTVLKAFGIDAFQGFLFGRPEPQIIES